MEAEALTESAAAGPIAPRANGFGKAPINAACLGMLVLPFPRRRVAGDRAVEGTNEGAA